jgi:hypothetical protein
LNGLLFGREGFRYRIDTISISRNFGILVTDFLEHNGSIVWTLDEELGVNGDDLVFKMLVLSYKVSVQKDPEVVIFLYFPWLFEYNWFVVLRFMM